jgi:vesicle coat complex subunit
VKLFLSNPEKNSTFILSLLQKTTDECYSPDVRDRAFIYWRLLNYNPQTVSDILSGEKRGDYVAPIYQDIDRMMLEIGLSSSLE